MTLPRGRTANLAMAIAVPAVAFTVMAVITHGSRAARRAVESFDQLGPALFGLILIVGFTFVWRALGRWALLAAVVYFPLMFYMVFWIGMLTSTFFRGSYS